MQDTGSEVYSWRGIKGILWKVHTFECFFVLSLYIFDVFGVHTKTHVLICIVGKGN